MENKIYKEFAETRFDKNKNYNAIISKVEEESPMKENRKYKRILNLAAIFAIAIIVAGFAPTMYAKLQWNINFKEYQNRDYEIGSATIKEAIESGYNEPIEMDYITQDGISVKIDTLLITDDYFESKINFKFADKIQVDSENFSFGYAVYDEEKNIYGVSKRMQAELNEKNNNYISYMYKELGVNYDNGQNQLATSEVKKNISADGRNIVSKIAMESNKGFTKSKKIYIRIFDLGYSMEKYEKEGTIYKVEQSEDFPISNAEWIFEINVPDKFHERETICLTLKDEIPGVEMQEATVTEVGMVMKVKIDGFSNIVFASKDITTSEWEKLRNETINITDEAGNIYYETSLGTLQETDLFVIKYEINKNMLNTKLFFNVKVNGNQYSSELIKK